MKEGGKGLVNYHALMWPGSWEKDVVIESDLPYD